MTLAQAASACHMPVGTFYGKVRNLEGQAREKKKNL